MRVRCAFRLRVLASALLFCITFAARAETDASFLLTATSKDLEKYFPTYLANGYFST